MFRCLLTAWLTAALHVVVGCGTESYIELTVGRDLSDSGASLAVGATDTPDDVEVDRIRFNLVEAGEADPYATRGFTLDPGQSFPLTVVMEPVEDTPNPVSIQVIVLWQEDEVAAGGVAIEWRKGAISQVPVELRGIP